jgi:hypothetical protein
VVVSFIGGGNLSARRKPLTCRKSLTNLFKLPRITKKGRFIQITAAIVSIKKNYIEMTRNKKKLKSNKS